MATELPRGYFYTHVSYSDMRKMLMADKKMRFGKRKPHRGAGMVLRFRPTENYPDQLEFIDNYGNRIYM